MPCSSRDYYGEIIKLLCEVISKIDVIVGKMMSKKYTFSLELQILSLLPMKNQNSCPSSPSEWQKKEVKNEFIALWKKAKMKKQDVFKVWDPLIMYYFCILMYSKNTRKIFAFYTLNKFKCCQVLLKMEDYGSSL